MNELDSFDNDSSDTVFRDVILLALSILFFKWHRADGGVEEGIVLPGAVTDL